MTNTVLVTDHDFENLSIERDVLEDTARVIELTDEPETTIEEQFADADAVINLRYRLSADAIAAMENTRVISRYGIGVDNIDMEAAAKHGIPVTNVPTYCIEEVTTHALTLILTLWRGVKRYDASVADGKWDRSIRTPIHRFSTRTVGIVGYGAIGREVGARVASLGANVLASDPFLTEEDLADEPARLVTFENLLDRSDFVTIHSPLTDATKGMFDRDAFARMQESGFVINVARGPVVDTDALHTALDAGEIAGAGLDVFPEEPPIADAPLRDHEDVITTPHIAWYSEEANADRRRTTARIVCDVLSGDEPRNVVNNVT